MIGALKSGKTTQAMYLARVANALIVGPGFETNSIDDRLSQLTEPAICALALGQNCIINTGIESIFPDSRKKIIKKCRPYADKIIGVFMNTDFQQCLRRIRAENPLYPSNKLDTMFECLKTGAPSRDEGYDELFEYTGALVEKNSASQYVYLDSEPAPMAFVAAQKVNPEIKINLARCSPAETEHWFECQTIADDIELALKSNKEVVLIKLYTYDSQTSPRVVKDKFSDPKKFFSVITSMFGIMVLSNTYDKMVLLRKYPDQRELEYSP
jgi:hypothetical protein